MKKALKSLAYFLGAIVLAIASALVVLGFAIDPNQFKPQLKALIKDQTGREIEFAGDLRLSVFPWLGVSTGQVSVKNRPGFQPEHFLSIEQGDVKVKVLPLLTRRVEITRIVLRGLRLNLTRNQDGKENWRQDEDSSVQPLAPASPGVAKPPTPSKAWQIFALGGVNLADARIHWEDRQSGKHFDISRVNLTVGRLQPEQFADAALNFVLDDPAAPHQDAIDLKTRVWFEPRLTEVRTGDTELRWTRTAEQATALSAVLFTPELRYNKDGQTLSIDKLQLRLGDLSVEASLTVDALFDAAKMAGKVGIAAFNPAKWLQQFGVDLPAFASSSVFGKLSGELALHATRESLSVDLLSCRLDDSLVQGNVRIEDFSAPSLRFDLAVDSVDAGRYLTKGKPGKTRLLTPSTATAAAFSMLPVERLNKLDVQGKLALQQLKINTLTMHDLHLRVNGKDGVVDTEQDIGRVYRGRYNGRSKFDARRSVKMMATDENIQGVDFAAFLQDVGSRAKTKISGKLSGSAALRGQGQDLKQIRQGLRGKLAFVLKDGVIKDLHFQNSIDQAIALLGQTPLQALQNGIDFSEISGTALLADRVVNNRDLRLLSPRFRIDGSGSTHLDSGRLDYRFVAHLVKTPAAGRVAVMHGTPIVVGMTGTWSDPDFRLDAAALLSEKNKAQIGNFIAHNKDKINKLQDKIDKKLGPGIGGLLRKLF